MLKLATLSLAALLAFASPAIAASKCIAPAKFSGTSTKIEGEDLKKFREIAQGLPEQVDLVLLLKNAPIVIAFSKGCMLGYGVVAVKPTGETL